MNVYVVLKKVGDDMTVIGVYGDYQKAVSKVQALSYTEGLPESTYRVDLTIYSN